MSNAITVGILAFDRRVMHIFLLSVQKSKKMVMGNTCGQLVGIVRGLFCRGPSAPCYYRISGVLQLV